MLRLRRLEVRAETADGPFGADFEFPLGLTIIRAENTSGKSTAVQGIIFALGLERMLSPKRQIPLTYAMTSHVEDDAGTQHAVVSSHVAVEVENAKGDVIAVRRVAKGDQNVKLINVWDGPMISEPSGQHRKRDYFVLDPGAATREAGFHRFLAEFIGWELPDVARYDGGVAPLYLESIFPLAIVEQKAGWAALPAQLPTYLGIREMPKRSVEFVLGLHGHDLELRRVQIQADLQALRQEWFGLRSRGADLATNVHGRFEGLPALPPKDPSEEFTATLLIPEGGEWIALTTALGLARARLDEIRRADIPSAQAVTDSVMTELEESTRRLEELTATQAEIVRDLSAERAHLRGAEQRIKALEEDLRKNQDARKLTELGSDVSDVLSASHCPTCHQVVTEVLLPPEAASQVMTVEDNIGFIQQQLTMLAAVVANSRTSVAQKERLQAGLSEEVRRLRGRIRAIKETLIQPSAAPALVTVQEQVALEERVRLLSLAEEGSFNLLQEAKVIAERHGTLLREAADLPSSGRSSTDELKLSTLENVLREQLAAYAFTTFPPNDLQISRETYRPMREGFEIGFEISASDAIRLKWAYQLGLLEVTRSFADTNHPGFVIFDEPGQQVVNKPSLKQLVNHAAGSRAHAQQVIVTTSEERTNIERFTRSVQCSVVFIDGRVLKPLT